MARGGKRPGAGRKKGAETKRTKARREMVATAAAEGITPLQVMLDAMRRLYKAKKYDEAAAIAKDAAPYVHPRLSAIQHKGDDAGGVVLKIIAEVVSVPPSGAQGAAAPGAG